LIKTNKRELLNNDVNWYGNVWNSFQDDLSAIGCGYWAKLYADLFANRFVADKETLERRLNVPNEIKAQGAAAVAGFLENLETQGIKRLNEARIVVIGEKGAGKTSLAKKLLNINAEMPKEYESTEGVDVTLWQLPEKLGNDGVNVHIWDFAGHVITHAAHRFFLSERCVYIIIYDGRTEMRNRLEYWLDHAKNYGGGSPVYIIVNKIDEHPPKINENTLRDKYPVIKDVKRLSIKNDLGVLETFKNELEVFIRQSPAWNKEFPAQWYALKENLQKEFLAKKDYITVDEFRENAKNFGINETDSERIREPLHNLGICLWYEKIAPLNTFVINPNWISYGVYKIINWLNDNGRFKLWLQDFLEIFSNEQDKSRYPSEKHLFLFNIMQNYELAYPIKNCEKVGLIIPFLLQEDQPERGMDKDFSISDSLLMRYKMETAIPPDTITRFIVRHYQDIQVNVNNKDVVWRYGVKLGDATGNKALVVEDDREIRLYVKGEKAKKYLGDLRSTLNDIFKSYQSDNPTIEYKVTETREQKPVYADDGTIMAYDIDGRLYLDATTGKEINMTIVNENYDVKDGIINKGNNNSMAYKSDGSIIGSTVYYVPPELTLENFYTLLEQLSTFLQSDKAVYESSPKDRESLKKELDLLKNEKDHKVGWCKLERFISAGGSIASIVSLFLTSLSPSAAVSIIPATVIAALKNIVNRKSQK